MISIKNKIDKALDLGIIKKTYLLVSDKKHLFIGAIALTILGALVSPLIPLSIRHTIDHYILNLDSEGLQLMGLLILGLLLVEAGISYSQTYLSNLLGQDAIKTLRERVYQKILYFKTAYFDKTPIGQLITRSVSDVERVADIFTQGLISIIGNFLQLIVILSIMFFYNWKITLAILSIMPILITGTYLFKEKIKATFNDVRTYVSRLNTFLQEHISGMSIIQSFVREEAEMEKFKKINAQHRDAHKKSVLYFSLFFPFIEIISATGLAILVWFGSGKVLQNEVSFGTLFMFIFFINMMFRPVRQIADNFNTLQMGIVSSERIFNILEKEEHHKDAGTHSLKNLNGHIRFDNVDFYYQPNKKILDKLSFEVPVGESLAIVGRTGAGKTTVTNLINRLYEYQSGLISIDGIPIQNFPLEELRNEIAIVLQDVFLFSDTIMNNIKMYNPNISDEQVYKTAALLGADKFIMKLPDGYNYHVKERGGTLSSGQRQMVSFLRAIIKNPKILILDEATSSVDQETEAQIKKATEILLKGRTSIIIAHRLASIRNAHQIMLMKDGSIVEKGKHEDLMKQNGAYANLIQLQYTELELQ